MIGKVIMVLGALLSAFLILSVRVYQICISPLLPPACRYTPSCSQYFILAVKKYGPVIGAWKGVCRVCRCHPFYPGGYDPP
jgi:putative membrane protein insertion efficiency factor